MVSLSLSSASLLDTKATGKALILEQGFDNADLLPIAKEFPALKDLIKEREFTGGLLSHLVIPVPAKDKA